MKIQQIRNATLKITYMGSTFLVDPWLQDKGTGFSAPTRKKEMSGIKNPMNNLPFSAEQILSDVEFCLITHTHPDHFTADYLPMDMKMFVQNKEDVKTVKSMGFLNVYEISDNGLIINDIHIDKTPCVHGSNIIVAKMMKEVHGFYISGEEKSVYIVGDTVLTKDISDILKSRKPDAVVLNCCEATLPLGRLIMNLTDIDSVCRLVPDSVIIASHLNSVNHSYLMRNDVQSYVQKKGLKQVTVPEDGEIINIP